MCVCVDLGCGKRDDLGHRDSETYTQYIVGFCRRIVAEQHAVLKCGRPSVGGKDEEAFGAKAQT